MCIIIDINIAGRVLTTDSDPDFGIVHACLFTGKPHNVRLVYGGKKFLTEYSKNHSVARIVAALDRAGKAFKIDDDLVDNEEEVIKISGLCSADDEHIIALARVSNVRLLCSHDKGLHGDFTDKRLLNSPRGKVYQNTSHNDLLRRFCK
ncbi:MAG: hypothetical protein K1X72_21510 [Pyrinomonadaceae bacterium]|nr:hypothetical protein [Pyrinomonadaceae bacterium]